MSSDSLDNIIDDNLLPEQDEEVIKALARKLRLRYLYLYLGLATGNVIVIYAFEDFLRSVMREADNPIITFYLGSLIWGFLLAFPFNLIPYKGIPYWKKYISTSFLIAAIVSGLLLAVLLLNVIVRL